MMSPGAQAGKHYRGCLCGSGDSQEQLGEVPWGAETRGCRPSGRVAASRGGAVAKASPRESSARRWPRVSGVEVGAGQRLRPGASLPGWAGQLEAAPCSQQSPTAQRAHLGLPVVTWASQQWPRAPRAPRPPSGHWNFPAVAHSPEGSQGPPSGHLQLLAWGPLPTLPQVCKDSL